MNKPVFVYDPTVDDQQSKVRGVGRYLQILQENFSGTFTFTNNLKSVPKDAVLINPFLDLLKPQIINKRYAKKQIAVIHDLIPLKYPQHFPIGFWTKVKLFFRKFVLGKYDLFITDSEVSKLDIIKILKIPAHKIKVIYPTVTRTFLPHLTWPPDENSQELFQHNQDNSLQPTFSQIEDKMINNQIIRAVNNFVLYVGDGTWNKNLVALVSVIKSSNLTCVCVGKVFENTDPSKLTHPWQKDLQWFMKEVKNDQRFILLGYISDYELLYLYKKARVNLLLSMDEGFGFSFLEAAICSTPSVLSDTPIFKEIAHNNALFANPHDPNDIAAKISEVFYNPHRREIYSIKAFERAEDFQPKLFQTHWNEAINTLLNPPVKPPPAKPVAQPPKTPLQ